MATVAPRRSGIKGPADLAQMEIRGGPHLNEDYAAWCQAAHDVNRAMALEMHAVALRVRRKMGEGATGIEKFTVKSQARRAVRPLLAAADKANEAADGVLRGWRMYLHVVTEIMAARTRGGSSRRTA